MTRDWRLVVVGETPTKYTPFTQETYRRFVEAVETLFAEMGATNTEVRFEDLDGNPLGRRNLGWLYTTHGKGGKLHPCHLGVYVGASLEKTRRSPTCSPHLGRVGASTAGSYRWSIATCNQPSQRKQTRTHGQGGFSGLANDVRKSIASWGRRLAWRVKPRFTPEIFRRPYPILVALACASCVSDMACSRTPGCSSRQSRPACAVSCGLPSLPTIHRRRRGWP